MTPAVLVLCGVLTLSVLAHVWLAGRQVRHLRAEGHLHTENWGRAVEVGIARARLGAAVTAAEAALIAWLTVGDGIAGLAALAERAGLPALAAGTALLTGVALLTQVPRIAHRAACAIVDARHGLGPLLTRALAGAAARAAAVTVGVAAPAALLLLLARTHLGASWWLAAWGIWVTVLCVRVLPRPRLLPTRDGPKPLAEPALAGRLEAMLERCGLGAIPVHVSRTPPGAHRANARMGGLGRGRRIVLDDTLLALLPPDEVVAVVAHEAGHLVKAHLARYLLLLAALAFAGTALLGALTAAGAALTGAPQSPAAALAVAALAVWALVPLVRPLLNAVRRHWEYEADACAARHADAAALARALEKLQVANASALTGDRLYTAAHSAHPPPTARIARLCDETAQTVPCPASALPTTRATR